MSALNHKSLTECKAKDVELYCAWRGQLLIQEQQLCDIVFRSPFSGSIPAQLPTKLDIGHVVAISELRKKFPEAAFRRNNYSDHEVISQDMRFRLYEVEMLSQDGPKVEQLIEYLKEKDLALVKYLNNQRVLILLASTALVKEKDSSPEEPARLQALFLIPSPGPKCASAKDVRCRHKKEEIPAQVALVLASLRHALLEAAKHGDGGRTPPNALVQQHIQEFAKRPKTLDLDGPDCSPLSFELDLGAPSETCPPSAYSHLQFYLLQPQNYALEIATAVTCLGTGSPSPPRGGTQEADAPSALKSDPLPPGIPTDVGKISLRPRCVAQANSCNGSAPPKPNLIGDRPLQRCKRRSSRLLGASARKMWSPLKALCLMENNKKRKKNIRKKRSLPSLPLKRSLSPPPTKQSLGRTADFCEPTLKLKNLQNPLRRKRGAEVLSAEFVQETRNELATKATVSSDDLDPSGKKPRLLRCNTDGEKLKSIEQMDIRRPVTRRSAHQESQMEVGDENKPWAAQDICSTSKTEECDSHALNMLADLALSSCNSPLVSNGSRSPPVGASPSREHRCVQEGKTLCKASDHEYHRATRNWRGGGSLSDQKSGPSLSPPGRSGLGPESPSSSQERGDPLSPRRKGGTKPAVSPKEVGELADPGMQSLISSEHSYASLASDSSKKGTPPAALDSRNGVKHAKAGPLGLPGKVLPFRHQQHLCPPHKQLKNCVPFMRSTIMAQRLKEDFSKFRKVAFCDRTVKVTFQREAEYLFSLDSKYTSHPLEKTVIRAVHGPWDVDLPDNVEEMKLIIHMWVALFYSKPFKSPLTRTVVEHSNPAKYVSLNSVVDPFEFLEDAEGSCNLEKGPADSLSEANRTPSEVDERAFSPSEKPLSCSRPSSTDGMEDEPPLVNSEEPSGLPWKEDHIPSAVCNSKDVSPSHDTEDEKELEEEPLLGSLVSSESPNRNSSYEQSDGHAQPQTFRADVEAEAKRAINIVDVTQSDTIPTTAELPESSVSKQPVAGSEVESQEIKSDSLPLEKKDSQQTGGSEPLHTLAVQWTEANAVSRVDISPCRDGRESQDLTMEEEDVSEESTEWESIDLALSESNDTDMEPQDVDLDQENEEQLMESSVVEEREADTASPKDSPLPSTQKVSALSAPNSASLNPVDLVEVPCLLRDDRVDSLVGVATASSQNHDEENESTKVEGTVKCSVCPNQTAGDDLLVISEEDKAIGLTEAMPKCTSELFQAEYDAAAQEELVKSQDSLVKSPLCAAPVDLADISCVSRENQDSSLTDPVKMQASPVHHTVAAEGIDLSGEQEASAEPTEQQVSQSQIDLIEDISQDGAEWIGAGTLDNWEPCRAQSDTSTHSESARNRDGSPVSAENLALAEEMDFLPGSSIPQEEGGVHLADTAQLPGGPGELTELPRNQEETVVAASDASLPEQVDFTRESCVPQEKQASRLPEIAPLPANEQHSTVTQNEQDSRQTEVMNRSSGGKESQWLEEDNTEFAPDSENRECGVEEENIGASSVTQEIVPGGNISQMAGTESKGTLCHALIDTVNATAVESKETWAKENSNLTWISSVHLESVTPPESDEESPTSDRLAHPDKKWVVHEYLHQGSIVADHERAASEDQRPGLPALCETMKGRQRETFERETLPENEASSAAITEVIPSSLGTFGADVDREQLECTPRPAEIAESSQEEKSSKLCEVDVEEGSREASVPEEEEKAREVGSEIFPCLLAESPIESCSEEAASCTPGDARESLWFPEEAGSSEMPRLPTRAAHMALNWAGESSLVDGGQAVAGDACCSKPGGLSRTPSTAVPGDVAPNFVCDLSLNRETSQHAGWMYLEDKERMLDAEVETMEHDGPFTSEDYDRPITPSFDNSHKPSPLKDYINFSVTKKQKEKTRTFHSAEHRDGFPRKLGSVPFWSKTWGLWNDPVQDTLDVECLRFHYKVKHILKKSQLSTSTAIFPKEFPSEVRTETFLSRHVPEGPALSPPPRSQSPLLITVRNSGPRFRSSYHDARSRRYRDDFEPLPPPLPFVSTPESLSKAARCKNHGQSPVPPFHLNKLTYNNKLKDFRGDISVIMDEFAELSRVMTRDDRQTSHKGQDPLTTSEDASEERCPFLPRRSAVYEHLFTDLCNTLHVRLKNVVQEACKKLYAFYLMETDDDPFFGRVKNLLKKGGHTETDPLHFCKTSHVETDRLMVIIRNEDIFSHIHKIPCLLRLKHIPSVTFAGVDSPEDILDHTYQEVFHRGGFVVSDDKILETMTVGELKEMVKTLETLRSYGRWRWLLHYQEVKQLREKARVDPAAHAKESLLKSSQGANLLEILHYHQCDSRASPKSEHLNCMLNLQVQHISERFAVFLTEKPSANRDTLESKGILALDVNTFLETAEDMATLGRSSC
uniref:Protein TASOR 2 n=1 Tax=Pogona vitticeps TaxID=103695 RepID=A0A6J0V7Y1_9SAUR